MLCRYCGMETRNPYVCEWCKRQLTTGAPAPVQQGVQPMDLTQPISPGMEPTQAVPQPQFRTALTGEAVPIAPAGQPAYPQPYAQQPYAQQPYAQQPYQQTYQQPYPQAVVPGRPPSVMPAHMAGLPGQAVGVELARSYTDQFRSSPLEKWEKCLAIVLPILLISVWIVHLSSASLPWVVITDFFFVAMAMGGTAAIGSYDDAYMDVGVVLVVSFLFGPATALVIYGIVSTIKQEGNGAIFALLTSHLLIRFVILLAFPANSSFLGLIPALLIFNVFSILAVCATFGGWILSSFFRPLNE